MALKYHKVDAIQYEINDNMTTYNHLKKKFLLVEPLSKTPYPPLGLLKISTMLRKKYKDSNIHTAVGINNQLTINNPAEIFITTLFTWDLRKVVEVVSYYKNKFPKAKINIGGIAASLLPDYIEKNTGIKPHIGLYKDAENCSPDYSLDFGRKIKASITFTSRGCVRKCKFCQVNNVEPVFFSKNDWEKDISENLPLVTFWDNNFLASSNFEKDCLRIVDLKKKVDFNQGIDARLFDNEKAKMLFKFDLDPIRFAFDNVNYEKHILNAIKITKKYSNKEIRVYVLYNFNDMPEDFFYRINLLNKCNVLSFPMEYRDPHNLDYKMPGKHWNTYLLRGLKLSLQFYYRKGMITESPTSFKKIYGTSAKQFIDKLYKIYNYDKSLSKNRRSN